MKYGSQYQDDYDYEAGNKSGKESGKDQNQTPKLVKGNYPEPNILPEVLAERVEHILPELGRLIVSVESVLLREATKLGVLKANGGAEATFVSKWLGGGSYGLEGLCCLVFGLACTAHC